MLFDVEPRWCLDTNIILSFFKEDDDEPYSRQLMPEPWSALESDISSGYVLAPPQIRAELETWRSRLKDLPRWLEAHRGLFVELNDADLAWAKQVVNAFPTYGRDLNYLGDLCVIALAGSRRLCVVTNERGANGEPHPRRPKIPDVCRDFGIDCVSFVGYLRRRAR